MPGVITLVGFGFYVFLAWGHSHGQVSVLDEGLYLYKGYLFATGEYQPFQDFGPLTNHMPLSFLIPGYVQSLFGSGIRTGRMMAIALGLIMLFGLWLVTKRISGRWWASAAVWTIALNSALIKVYSQAVSQVLVVCMLVWVLVLVAGQKRSQWQILLGVLLSSILLFTRINMAPVLPILIAYIFWQYGKKTGVIALIWGSAAVIIGHSVYWPDILKLWAKWIPEGFSPLLSYYRLPSDVIPLWNPQIAMMNRIDSLQSSLKMHLISFAIVMGTSMILLIRGNKSEGNRDIASTWLIIAIFGSLFIAHAAVSLGLDYCVYCLRNYMAFFSPIGLIIIGIFSREIVEMAKPARSMLVLGLVSGIPFMLGFPLGRDLLETILKTDVTKISGFSVQPGTHELSVLLKNKSGLGVEALITVSQLIVYGILLLVPLITIMISLFGKKRTHHDHNSLAESIFSGLAALLVMEMLIANVYFTTGYSDFDCGADIIEANEDVGQYLESKVPEGSRVYWGVGRSPVPILYLPNRKIYPSQLNGDYTFMLSGESEVLERFGYWDAQLARSWLVEADYVLVEERVYSDIHLFGFDEKHYDEMIRTRPTNPCRADSSILIFRNLQGLE